MQQETLQKVSNAPSVSFMLPLIHFFLAPLRGSFFEVSDSYTGEETKSLFLAQDTGSAFFHISDPYCKRSRGLVQGFRELPGRVGYRGVA